MIGGLAAIIFLAAAVERFVFNDRHINLRRGDLAQGENCQSNATPEFKHAMTDPAKILFIHPLGSTEVDSVGSSYIVVKDDEEAPIYNPTDAVLEKIVLAKGNGSGKAGEYTLYFRVSCEVTYSLGQLDKVSDKITSLLAKGASAQGMEEVQPQVFIKGGELLGYTDGVLESNTFTFTLLNKTRPIEHINAQRWEQDQANFAQCPYDYFDTRNDNNLKRYYSGKLLSVNLNVVAKVFDKNKMMRSAHCGDINHDIAGTVSGGWFRGESTDRTGDYLSVNTYLSTAEIALRRDGQIKDVITDYSPDVFPLDVKIGQAQCYHDQNQNRWAFVRLVSDSQMALALGKGSCPTTFPASMSAAWIR